MCIYENKNIYIMQKFMQYIPDVDSPPGVVSRNQPPYKTHPLQPSTGPKRHHGLLLLIPIEVELQIRSAGVVQTTSMDDP